MAPVNREQMRKVSRLLTALTDLAANDNVEMTGEVYVDGEQVGFVRDLPVAHGGEYAIQWLAD